jgi:hypothetical protein
MLRSLRLLQPRTLRSLRLLQTTYKQHLSSTPTPTSADEEQEEQPELFDLPLHTTIPFPITGTAAHGSSFNWHLQPGDAVQREQVICEDDSGGVGIKSHVDGYLAWSNSNDSTTATESPIEGGRAPLAVLVGRKEDVSAFQTFAPTVENRELVYDGLFGALIRRVKIISVSSCGLTMLSMPMLAIFGDESVPVSARVAVAGVVMFFGAGTTATVHWMCHPYITQMWRNTQDHYTAESVNMFGRRKYTNFVASDVVMADSRPFSTFKLEPYNHNYYVHTDDECWRPDEHRSFFFTRQDD